MSVMPLSSSNPARDPMTGAVVLAVAFKDAGFTPAEIATSLMNGEVYPMLTAVQLGNVLLGEEAFPELERQAVKNALRDARKFTVDVIDKAVDELFGPPLSIGPVGGGTAYANGGHGFNDLPFATPLRAPIVGFNLRVGAIVNAIQAIYAPDVVAPQHGGAGGRPIAVRFPVAADPVVQIYGTVGPFLGDALYVTQIGFRTLQDRDFGPFPEQALEHGTRFRLSFRHHEMKAIFGQTAGPDNETLYLARLGVYAAPTLLIQRSRP